MLLCRNFTRPGTDNRATNLKQRSVNKSTLEVYSKRNCHWSQKTIPLPLLLPKNASQQKIEHQGCKKKQRRGRKKRRRWRRRDRREGHGENSRDAPAFLLMPPVWATSCRSVVVVYSLFLFSRMSPPHHTEPLAVCLSLHLHLTFV